MSQQIGKKLVTYLKTNDTPVFSGEKIIPSSMCLAEIIRETPQRYIVTFLAGDDSHLIGRSEKYVNKKDVIFMNINYKGWTELENTLAKFRDEENKYPDKKEEILERFLKKMEQIKRGV